MDAAAAGPAAVLAHATRRSRVRRLRGQAGRALLHLVLVAAGLTFVAPLFWVVSTSLKPGSEVFTYPIHWVPTHPLWSNYADIFGLIEIGGRPGLVVFAGNSASMRTVPVNPVYRADTPL